MSGIVLSGSLIKMLCLFLVALMRAACHAHLIFLDSPHQ